jgi:excisionase family DNA binding protein
MQRVRGFRKHHGIEVFRSGEWAERGEITLDAAAEIIGVHKMTALRMIERGDIKARQPCPGAPWAIKADSIAPFAATEGKKRPVVTPNPSQQTFDFQ